MKLRLKMKAKYLVHNNSIFEKDTNNKKEEKKLSFNNII